MEIIHEMKMDVTIIDKNAKEGSFPMSALDMADLEAKLKEAIGADDLHLTDHKRFERD